MRFCQCWSNCKAIVKCAGKGKVMFDASSPISGLTLGHDDLNCNYNGKGYVVKMYILASHQENTTAAAPYSKHGQSNSNRQYSNSRRKLEQRNMFIAFRKPTCDSITIGQLLRPARDWDSIEIWNPTQIVTYLLNGVPCGNIEQPEATIVDLCEGLRPIRRERQLADY